VKSRELVQEAFHKITLVLKNFIGSRYGSSPPLELPAEYDTLRPYKGIRVSFLAFAVPIEERGECIFNIGTVEQMGFTH
jgi:hypothetical protein